MRASIHHPGNGNFSMWYDIYDENSCVVHTEENIIFVNKKTNLHVTKI